MKRGGAATSATRTAPAGLGYAWYVVSVLMLAQTCSFIDRMIMGLLVGPIRATFSISDTQYSLLAGLAFAIFYSIMGLPLARIADRHSRRWLIAIGISFWSLMTAACGLAQGFWQLFLARMGVGVGEATLSPAAYSLISDYFPKHMLARAFSVFTLGVTIGSGLAYMIGGQVIALTQDIGAVRLPVLGEVHGWQATFLFVGAPGLLIALLMMTVREPQRTGLFPGAHHAQQVPISTVLAYFATRRRAVATHVIGASIFIMAVFSLNIWGPEYLVRTFGYSRAEAGLTFGAVMMTAGTLGLLTGGVLADRSFAGGRRDAYSRIILLSMAGMAPFAILLAFVSTPTLGVACLAAAVFFSAFQGGLSGGVMQLMTPNQMRGQAVALFLLTANLLGLGLGPTVVAVLTDFVFRSDAALNKSLALASAILIPLAAVIMLSGLKQVRAAIAEAQTYA